MKITSNHVAIIAACAWSTSLSVQASTQSSTARLEPNAALLANPRYREEHPEILRAESAATKSHASNANYPLKLSRNAALANSPRFPEEHPELLRRPVSEEEALAKASEARKQLAAMMENVALASSPRAREDPPELLHIPTSMPDLQVKKQTANLRDVTAK
jgi:hypothetical protein